MNKQELQNEINKTKEHLANMEKMLAECEYERWKPEKDELYWYVNSRGESCCAFFSPTFKVDTDRYNIFNCFYVCEQAEAEAEKILIRRQLEDIARRLNKGEKIDWNNSFQAKYYLEFNHLTNKLKQQYNDSCQAEKTYCLDKHYLDVAIQEIGEERLKKYLRGE